MNRRNDEDYQKMRHRRRGRRRRKNRSAAGRIISVVIMLAALGVFGFSAFKLYGIYSGYKNGEDEYDELVEIAISGGMKDGEDSRFQVDFDALREINPDVVAWLRFEEPSIINYPVVQSQDNDKYLEVTFKGYENTVGTLFVNADNHPDFNDRNTIIYGHHMNNGTMFNTLEDYQDEELWKDRPYFYIYTPDGMEHKYQIFAAGVVGDTSEAYTYQFADDESFQSFLNFSKSSSYYDTGIMPAMTDKIVTLSTCTKASNSDRMIVQGVEIEANP